MIIILCDLYCSYIEDCCTNGKDEGVSGQTGLGMDMMHIHNFAYKDIMTDVLQFDKLLSGFRVPLVNTGSRPL